MNTYIDEIYELEMYSKKSKSATVFCDLIIVDKSNMLYAANLIGQESKVKYALELIQDAKLGNVHRAEGARFASGQERISIGTHYKKANYDEETSKIDDLTHTFVISKTIRPDLKLRSEFAEIQKASITSGIPLPEVPQDLTELVIAWGGDIIQQVYDVLDDRYNTPMLPEWKEYIFDALVEEGYLEVLSVKTFGTRYDIEAANLRVTEKEIEKIITQAIEGAEFEFAIQEDGRTEDEAVLPYLTSIDDYLTNFAGELGSRIQENVQLRFEPGKDVHHPAFHDVNMTANQNGITGLFPPQANTVMGVSNTLSEEKFCFLIGEMGTGKTVQGAIIPYMTEAILQNKSTSPSPKRVIVMSPGIMVEKWAREIEERIPGCKTFQIQHWTDVKRIAEASAFTDKKGKTKYKEPDTWEYYILSSESPKFVYPVEAQEDFRIHPSMVDLYELPEPKPRMVRRMERQEDGTYRSVLVEVQDKGNRIRLEENSVFDAFQALYRTQYAPGETSQYCPDCGGKIMVKRQGEEEPASEHFYKKYNKSSDSFTKNQTKENSYCKNEVDTATLPKERIKEWKFNKTTGRYEPKNETQVCGYSLWQPSREINLDTKKSDWKKNVSGYRKVSPAWYINKHLPRGFFKYFVADEVHEYKGGDSSTGRAFGHLVNHTEKQVLLTGTLMGGMSRDIFYLLARLNPSQLLKEGITYKDESVFNSRYGISEHNTRMNGGAAKKSSNQKPGISPHLFPMYLMGNCAFLELSDMGYALPPYQEVPVAVNMTPKHMASYKEIGHEIMSTMRNVEGLGGMSSISRFMNAMYQYADAPFNTEVITAHTQEGTQHVLGHPYNFNQHEFTPSKVNQMIDILDEEIHEHNRKNLIYVKYTGKESWNEMDVYLYEKLKALGYNVGILRSGGSYDGIKMPKNSRAREAWLHQMMEKHDWDILITNARLVKVGLDLIQFPNIHFFQFDYSTYDYMQASRRSWRLKQTKDVKVFTYFYKDTIQEKGIKHIARKIDAAMAMQGKFSEEGLRAMADSGDGMNALAKQLMKDDVLEDIETVHDMFARKNQTFEEMQSVEFTDYDGYVMNPDYDLMISVRDGLIKDIDAREEKGEITKQEADKSRAEILEAAELFATVMNEVEDVSSYNRGVAKKKQVISGQQEFDLFALV